MPTAGPTARKVPCEQCPLRSKKYAFRDFTPRELEFVSSFKIGELTLEPGGSLSACGSAYLYTVLSGWAFRYRMLPDGRRQILNFALPGDLLGLQGAMLDDAQHFVEALSDLVLCVFPREKLSELYRAHPSLGYDVTWLAAREEQMLDEHLLSIGRRTALERMAYLLLHLFVRAEQVGLTRGSAIQFPFTQQHLADTLGMSLVHANKTLKRLTASRAVRWKDRSFEILDREALARIAQHDAAGGRPRPFI